MECILVDSACSDRPRRIMTFTGMDNGRYGVLICSSMDCSKLIV